MFGQTDSDDYQPFGYVGRVPLYFTTLLLIAYTASMIALVVAAAMGAGGVADFVPYESYAVLHGFQFWRFVTYPFLNGPSLWFVVDMIMLYVFGRDVERFIGRRAFIALWITMVLAVPCVLTAAGVWLPPFYYGGGRELNFGVFVAFVAIYGNVEIFFTIKAKWIALLIGTIIVLECLQARAWTDLLAFLVICATAWLFVKQLRGQISLRLPGRDFFRRRRSRRSLRVMPAPGRPVAPRKAVRPQEDVLESIDPLLDKIAKTGLASLTARERERLERARAELLKKEPR